MGSTNFLGLGEQQQVAAVLRDVSRGHYQEVDSSANRWRDVYVEVLGQISIMRNDPSKQGCVEVAYAPDAICQSSVHYMQ